MVRSLIADIVLAGRTLSKRPTFAVAAILTLGVGIAANTSVFGLLYSVLLRPLPYPDADRLVGVVQTNDRRGVTTAATSLHDLEDWRAGTRAFVGLAADARMTELEAAPASTIYVPMRQAMSGFGGDWSLSFVVRTDGRAGAIPAAARRVVQAVAPTLPIFEVESMDARVDAAVGARRSAVVIFAVFAGCALLLAVVGLYGLLAGSVARRTREIGVRIAVGASPGAVWRLIVGHGLRLVAGGVVVGCVVTVAGSRLMTTLLFDVAPTDPLVYLLAAAGVATTAVVACLVPARRAMRLDPVTTLRAE